ncbi:translation initiation factor IF-2-like [Malaclemys terrapin pileata]|uniref:translation initiation factor IF-2-like n=1 Tax=Malaclemys terrapin pileata TaxID=2991368 RepID=UPI0023A8A8B7|nr:translation initiation factor IF-2-like [Malaclemys terrapin pileata]
MAPPERAGRGARDPRGPSRHSAGSLAARTRRGPREPDPPPPAGPAGAQRPRADPARPARPGPLPSQRGGLAPARSWPVPAAPQWGGLPGSAPRPRRSTAGAWLRPLPLAHPLGAAAARGPAHAAQQWRRPEAAGGGRGEAAQGGRPGTPMAAAARSGGDTESSEPRTAQPAPRLQPSRCRERPAPPRPPRLHPVLRAPRRESPSQEAQESPGSGGGLRRAQERREPNLEPPELLSVPSVQAGLHASLPFPTAGNEAVSKFGSSALQKPAQFPGSF